VSQLAKLIAAVRNNPADVRFDDACKLARMMGYVSSKKKRGRKGSGSSHEAYSKTGEALGLNFQDRDGSIPTYQARQLIDALDKFEEEK